MNLFDAFIIIVILYSTISAFRRGFLRETSALVGTIVGILVASWTYTRIAVLFSRVISNNSAAHCVSFLLVLIVVMALFAVVGVLLQRTASAIGLAFFDRSAGALFGMGRGVLFCVAIMMAVAAFFPTAAWVTKSALAPYLLSGAHAVSFVVPRNFRQQIRDGAGQLLQQPPLSLDRPNEAP